MGGLEYAHLCMPLQMKITKLTIPQSIMGAV